MKTISYSIKYYLDSIVVKYNNRRLCLFPHKTGISIMWRRTITKEEKIKLSENPTQKLLTAGTNIENNRIIDTEINLSYESSFLLVEVLRTNERELKTRQIVNSVIEESARPEVLVTLNAMDLADFGNALIDFESDNIVGLMEHLNNIKRKLCDIGVLERKETDQFGKPLN